jgi:hypothetical protein
MQPLHQYRTWPSGTSSWCSERRISLKAFCFRAWGLRSAFAVLAPPFAFAAAHYDEIVLVEGQPAPAIRSVRRIFGTIESEGRMAEPPELIESTPVNSFTAEGLGSRLASLSVIRGVQVPREELGRYKFEFTVLNKWRGAGGPWRLTTEVYEEGLAGRGPEGGASSELTHTFPPDAPDLVAPIPIRLTVTSYGPVVVLVGCEGRVVETYRLEVIPPDDQSSL